MTFIDHYNLNGAICSRNLSVAPVTANLSGYGKRGL